ncbi:MAG: ATP-grasp domain-containing protein, partial [Flavobacteriaceae bacterium]|nr:ATP-grasp domain-containing protein [Flavobacteriaceae bacterium]
FLYTNSENSFAWVAKNLGPTSYPDLIGIFKDKVRFRELIAKLYPEVFFKKVSWTELDSLDKDTLSYPLVMKPTVGFFSLGVNIVKCSTDWDAALLSLKKDVSRIKSLYPEQVINVSDFIIESYIEGEEFAFDCYFNAEGEPVVLTVMKHLFSSESDVSDRLYMTSVDIVVQLKDKVETFLKQLGDLIPMSNFPLHIEVRLWKGKLIPIEVNPMRFGGWCTTADVTWYAYGFNSYEYFFNQRQPDWENILKREDRATYSIVILDIPATQRNKTIKGFDYEKLLTRFENPLELRKIDFNQHPVFGFLFTRTSVGNFNELEAILHDDLSEFIL